MPGLSPPSTGTSLKLEQRLDCVKQGNGSHSLAIMADYSHIRKACLPGFARQLREGWQPYDEHLYDVLPDISPPLLDDASMEALRRYFWPAARTRGRPPKEAIGRVELARMLAATRRRGPAGTIARYLQARLLSGVPHSILPEWSELKRFQDKQFVRSVIRLLGDEIGQMLVRGAPYRHATLGDLDLGPINLSLPPRVRALKATKHVMRNRFAMHPPSMRRMANVASEWAVTRKETPPQVRHLLDSSLSQSHDVRR